MDQMILEVQIKLLNLSMEMCLKHEVMKYQNLHSRKKLRMNMADKSAWVLTYRFSPTFALLRRISSLIMRLSSSSDLSLFLLSSIFFLDLYF